MSVNDKWFRTWNCKIISKFRSFNLQHERFCFKLTFSKSCKDNGVEILPEQTYALPKIYSIASSSNTNYKCVHHWVLGCNPAGIYLFKVSNEIK